MSTSRGIPYYYNKATGETCWERPTTTNTAGSGGGKVHAYHLLVKHCKSRRPASWRSDNITRTPEEALSILKNYEDQIRSSGDLFSELKELASQYSDCSSAKQDGDLGEFGRGQMQKAFEEAAFALKPGELSGPVNTDSGVHLIYRFR